MDSPLAPAGPEPYPPAIPLDSPIKPGYPNRATDESPCSHRALGSKPQGQAIHASSRCCLWAVICRKSLTLMVSRGGSYDGCRRELQSFFASPPAPFAFDPPNTMKDGRTRVSGMSPDGLAFLELIGPAHNLQQTHMTVDWSGTQAERIPSAAYLLSFAALSAPGDDSNSKTARTDWVTDNVVNAMLSGQASTTHQGLRFTLEFFEELRFLSLTVEPAR